MNTHVFLHGSPGSAEGWGPLLEHAPAGARCEAWDLIEHGAREDAPEATLEDVVAEVVERVRTLDGPVTLVGHSFGSWVAARALGPLGDRVARFVAIGGVAGLPGELAERSLGFAAMLEAGQLPLAAAAQAAADIWLPVEDRDPASIARVARLIEGDRVDRLARILRRQAGLADPVNRVAPYATPATLIHSVGDRGAPIALGRELAALGSNAELIELEGDDHFPQWSRPAEIASYVFVD